jgi:hypothetical protein
MHFAAVGERADTAFIAFFVVINDQGPVVVYGVIIAEFDHLREFPFGIYMHKRKRYFDGIERFLGQSNHYRGVFSDGIEHHRIFEFGSYLADDVDGFGFQFP